jgi:hypothetical protein
MKIDNLEIIKEKITQLGKTQTFNIALAHQVIDFMLSRPPLVKKTNVVKKMNDEHLSEIDAYQTLLLNQWIKNPVIKKYPELLSLSVKSFVRKLDHDFFIHNPYYQRVKPKPITQGNWQLSYETFTPYQGVLTGDVISHPTNHYLDATPFGYFTKPFYYLVIKQHDVTWMSVTPFEINTMAPILEQIRGKVVTLGLGLGYFAAMAALKPEVNEVVVIEQDKQVIQLFLTHIYPQLPNKEKITIIHDDAFTYLKTSKRPFDHLFVDIYHTADDGLPIYMRMKKIEQLSTSGKWHYWLESSIISLFRRYMVVFLQEQLLSFDSSHYAHPNNKEDEFYRGLYLINEDTLIQSLTDIDQWLSDSSIQDMLTRLQLSKD